MYTQWNTYNVAMNRFLRLLTLKEVGNRIPALAPTSKILLVLSIKKSQVDM